MIPVLEDQRPNREQKRDPSQHHDDDEQHDDDAFQRPYSVKHQQQQRLQHDDEQHLRIDVDKMDEVRKNEHCDDNYVELQPLVQQEDEIPLLKNSDKHYSMMMMKVCLMNKQKLMDNIRMLRLMNRLMMKIQVWSKLRLDEENYHRWVDKINS